MLPVESILHFVRCFQISIESNNTLSRQSTITDYQEISRYGETLFKPYIDLDIAR